MFPLVSTVEEPEWTLDRVDEVVAALDEATRASVSGVISD